MTSFFSIIIPVYNVAPYLRECLDSVLAQTFTDWECICVDDGSTDGSGEILDEYAAKDKRFVVVHKANAGVSEARNSALRMAKGEWIWFVDSDDRIKSNALERFVRYECKADITYFGMDFIYEDGCRKTVCYKAVGATVIDDTTTAVFANMVKSPMGVDFFGYTWNKFFKNEIIQKNNIVFASNIALWEDALFILHFLNHAQTFAVIGESLYEYKRYTNGLTKRSNKPFYEVGRLFENSISAAKFLPLRKLAYDRAMLCYDCMSRNEGAYNSVKNIVRLYRRYSELANNELRFKVLGACRFAPVRFAVIAYLTLRFWGRIRYFPR